MFKPIITQVGVDVYMVQFESLVSNIQMSPVCAMHLQRYIDSVHPTAVTHEVDGQSYDSVEETEVPNDRENGDHKEMDDGVSY